LNREKEKMTEGSDMKDMVLHTSKEQLRALMSILIVAIIGLVPAATSSGIGSDVQRPLATVIIGGLTCTLLFAPIIIPPLYYWVQQRSKNKQTATEETE